MCSCFHRYNIFSATPSCSDTSLAPKPSIISILAASRLNSLVYRRLFISGFSRLENPLSFFLRTDQSGILKGGYSRRINIRHRVVYEVFEQEKKVHVLRM